MPETQATLVYDGDCGICRYWVNYWRGLTGERIVYRPFQEAARDFPAITPEAFRRSIQLIEADGRVYCGAGATFRLLRETPGRALGWWFYAHVPGFAVVSEFAYTFFARRRGLLNRVSRLAWGPALEPERYELVSWVFLRLLGAVYVAAFASLSVQIRGLVGSAGILPVADFLEAVHEALGGGAYRVLPTLFWINASDTALVAATVAGVVSGLFVVLDRGTRPALVAAFVLYLSCVHAAQDFMGFQWDMLLLETGFLAIFLTGGSRIVVWLYRWLAFRYLFLAGAVKVLSGDPTWHNLTALEYHFWSQPLPTPLAWYAAQLPSGVLVFGTGAALVTELGAVFLFFLPRRIRAAAACLVLFFQTLILVTGNYTFFNLLSMLLCLPLFDDAALRRLVPSRLASLIARGAAHPGRTATGLAAALAVIVVPVGLNRIWQTFTENNLPVVGTISDALSPLLIVNPYGLFAVMTTSRPEIVIEGSDDGEQWREYVFPYKPGPVTRPLLWNIPHQPRLDWQMWFAALGGARDNPWFGSLLARLLEGSAPVIGLFDSNPFPVHPPKFVRARLYDYRFAAPAVHDATGQWWVRRPLGWYFPTVTLREAKGTDDAGSVGPPSDSLKP